MPIWQQQQPEGAEHSSAVWFREFQASGSRVAFEGSTTRDTSQHRSSTAVVRRVDPSARIRRRGA